MVAGGWEAGVHSCCYCTMTVRHVVCYKLPSPSLSSCQGRAKVLGRPRTICVLVLPNTPTLPPQHGTDDLQLVTTPRAGLVSSDKLRLALLTLWANILTLRSFRNELVDGGLHSCVRWWVVGCGREMNEIFFDQSTFLVTFLVLLIFFRINVIMTYILYI